MMGKRFLLINKIKSTVLSVPKSWFICLCRFSKTQLKKNNEFLKFSPLYDSLNQQIQYWSFFFLIVLEYGWLKMLYKFQVHRKSIQSYICLSIYLSIPYFLHIGYSKLICRYPLLFSRFFLIIYLGVHIAYKSPGKTDHQLPVSNCSLCETQILINGLM